MSRIIHFLRQCGFIWKYRTDYAAKYNRSIKWTECWKEISDDICKVNYKLINQLTFMIQISGVATYFIYDSAQNFVHFLTYFKIYLFIHIFLYVLQNVIKKRSLLTRGEESLAKIASLAKQGDSASHTINARNFVFQYINENKTSVKDCKIKEEDQNSQIKVIVNIFKTLYIYIYTHIFLDYSIYVLPQRDIFLSKDILINTYFL